MRILFVAMPDSIHVARWTRQVADQGWDLHLFAATPALPHTEFRNVTIWGFPGFRPEGLHPSVRVCGLWPAGRGALPLGRRALRFYPAWLAWLVRRLKPDVVHSLEIQHSGYLALAARERLDGRFPPWIVTNWGSDIYVYGRLGEHEERIRQVLAACDFYSSECARDVELAREFGFGGEALTVLPNGGGFDLELMRSLRQPGPVSGRRLVVVKGRQNWAGRALVALRGIELAADALEGYEVAVYLATPDVRMAAELLAGSSGIPVRVVPPSPREDVLRLHGRARVSVGLSIGDGIATSALEAVAMGAFPVQSNTSCLGEWIEDGRSGLLVHPEDPEGVAGALRRALGDDELVDQAAERNDAVLSERLDAASVAREAVALYRQVEAGALERVP